MSRGRGISVYSNLAEIKDLIGADLNVIASGKWVAQKYIEHPMLIHDVKFDIRQWFVVTDWEQLTVWMYRKLGIHIFKINFQPEFIGLTCHMCSHVTCV